MYCKLLFSFVLAVLGQIYCCEDYTVFLYSHFLYYFYYSHREINEISNEYTEYLGLEVNSSFANLLFHQINSMK